MMESLIKNRIMFFLDKEKLLSPKQRGFMPRKSTVTQLVNCSLRWQWARNSKITTEISSCIWHFKRDSSHHRGEL